MRHKRAIKLVLLVASVGVSSAAIAVEVMKASELAEHCRHFPDGPQQTSADFCARYVQGFIDGAVSTDVRVMRNVEAEYEGRLSVTERAMQTRMRRGQDLERAAGYAEFCLGEPVPLREVVEKVARDLTASGGTLDPAAAARDVVYSTLRDHFPCRSDDA